MSAVLIIVRINQMLQVSYKVDYTIFDELCLIKEEIISAQVQIYGMDELWVSSRYRSHCFGSVLELRVVCEVK